MNTIELLKKARELITDPDHWVQDFFGVHQDGAPLASCAAGDPGACKWCAWGAILCIRQREEGTFPITRDEAVNEIEKDLGIRLATYNDNATHKEVLSVFDTTIERLENAND